MGLRILGQKWAVRAKRATSGKNRDNKRSVVKEKGQQKIAGGNTKSIHDNPSTENDIILMRQLSEGEVPNRQKRTTKCGSVTCNRASGKTKRVQRTTQVCAGNTASND